MEESNSQRAYQATKDAILSGEIRGGQLLSEVEVATQLGVSRTPVHEAFLRLAAEGLLEMLPRRGAVVVAVSAQDATDLLEMRLALETAAIRRVFRTPATVDTLVADLTDLLDEQRHVATSGDKLQFATTDDAFHRRIVEFSGNSIGIRFYCSLSDCQRRMMSEAAQGDSIRMAHLIEDHRQLAAAIGRLDLGEFEATLIAHLQTTYRVGLS